MGIAIPGDFGGITEEITAGENAFEENGSVYSCAVGVPLIDKAKRTLSVKSFKQLKPLARGDIAIAFVREVFDQVAQVEILKVEGDGKTVLGSPVAFLRISEVQRSYVENLRDHLRVGDYIRAKVIDVTDLGVNISIALPEFGVVKAVCTRCRGDMEKTGATFTCLECGSREQRKAAQVE